MNNTLQFAPSSAVRRFTVLLLAAIGTSACAGFNQDPLEYLGSTDATPAPASSSASLEPQEPFTTPWADFAGHWVGQAEEPLALSAGAGPAPIYRFPSGETRIFLDLEATDHGVEGTITFGAGRPPALPTSADQDRYPAEVSYADVLSYAVNGVSSLPFYTPLPPWEGFPYVTADSPLGSEISDTLLLGAALDGVLRLSYNINEILEPWCQLQTPNALPDGGYGCHVSNGGGNDSEGCYDQSPDDTSACPGDVFTLTPEQFTACVVPGAKTSVPCARQDWCGSTSASRCGCDSVHCSTALAGREDSPRLNLRRVGDELIGVVDGGVFLNARRLLTPLGKFTFRRAD
jgi:hypothetical protein